MKKAGVRIIRSEDVYEGRAHEQQTNKSHTSKFLSLVLRHKPEEIGIVLDEAGWIHVADTAGGDGRRHGTAISEADLREIVAASDKQRFALDQ